MKNSRPSLISRTLDNLWKLWRRRQRQRGKLPQRGMLRAELLESRLPLAITAPLPGVNDHIHPVLSIYVEGQQVVIPPNVGITSTTALNPHTHDFTGTLHIGEGGPAGLSGQIRNVNLADFFDVWRSTNVGQPTNNPSALLDTDPNDGTPLPRFMGLTVNSSTHVLRMYVKEAADAGFELEYDSSQSINSIPRPELYIPRDHDQIVLSYERIAQAAFGPFFQPIPNQTVLVGAPLWVPLDGFDANGGPITYEVTVGNSNLLEAVVPTGNRSLVIDVANFGTMTFELFDDLAPRVTNRIVQLVQMGFYNLSQTNQITFHRVVPNFVIQAGDPTGTGGGGSSLPNFDDQFHVDLQHTSSGILSMAKSSDDTNDSQFFITDTATRFLDFNHSIFGRLVEGEAIRDAINSVATTNDRPVVPVVINSITVVQNDAENGVLMLKAKPGATGSTSVTVTARDPQNNTFSHTFQVTFAADTFNGAPFLADIPPVQGVSGQPIQFQLTAIDVEGDPVVFSAIRPATETVNYTLDVNSTTGLVTVTPPPGFVGTFNVLARVRSVTPNSTGSGQDFDEQLVPVTVGLGAPSVDLAAGSDTGISNSDNITGAATLDFLVSGVGSGATVNLYKGTTLLAQGTAVGTSITLTVVNAGTVLGQGVSTITATQTVGGQESAASPALNVTYDSIPPEFTSTPPSVAHVGFNLDYNAQTNEEGSSGFSYSLVSPPTGATINAATGVVSWTPAAGQTGGHAFDIVATDAAGNSRTQSLTVTVNVARVDLVFTVTTLDGSPLSSVAIGQEFLLLVLTNDLRTPARGVFAAYLDVMWDSTKAQVVAANLANPLTFGAAYTNARSGNAQTPGLIDEAGAFDGITELGGGEHELFRVRMRATASGEIVFFGDPADDLPLSNISVYDNPGVNPVVPQAEVHYGRVTVTVASTFNAVGDTFTVNEDTQNNSLNPLANDTSVGGANNTLTISAVGPTSHGGAVVIAPDGKTLSYTPSLNFFGTESFTYTARNQNNEEQSATITVTVNDVNDPPTAVGDALSVTRNSSNNVLNVLANDLIAPDENETLRVTAVGTGSAGGSIAIGPGGANILYTPAANFSGSESFTYTISDRESGGLTSQAVVTVTVSGLAANNDSFTVLEDSSNNEINPLANDQLDQQAGGTLSITAVGTGSAGGTISITSGNTRLAYTPSANFQGIESFTYTISDGVGNSAVGTVTMNVTNVNDPPTAVNDSVTGFKNTGSLFDVLANDTSLPDPPEDLVIDSVTQPAGGTVTIVESGKRISFVPATDFTGTTSFTYTIRDPGGLTSNAATVTITVQEFAPSSLSGFVYFDTDHDGEKDGFELPIAGITITLTGTTSTGTAVNQTTKTQADGSYRFENLAPGTYTIIQSQPAFTIDGKDTVGTQGGSASTKNRIVITNMPQGTTGTGNNFAERGRAVSTMSIRDLFSSVSRNYALVAVDAAGVELWHSMSNPAWEGYTGGTFSLQSNQLRLETINPQAQAVVATIPLTSSSVRTLGTSGGSRLYRVNGGPSNFTFTPTTPTTNQPPTAVSDSFTATVSTPRTVSAPGVLANDTDPENDALSAVLVGQATSGTVTLASSGAFTYTPSTGFLGIDSFTYRASDGTSTSGLATVTITVRGPNAPPVTVADLFTVTEDVPLTVAAAGLLQNDTDPDGDALTLVNVTQPPFGTVAFSANGSFTYTPSANFNGNDSFTYQASDGIDLSPVTTVTMVVTPVNDAPVAQNDTYATGVNTTLTVVAQGGVLLNDFDVDGDPLTATLLDDVSHGGLIIHANGAFTYTPSAGFTGIDSFTYRASDGALHSTATVTIIVTDNDVDPIALNDSYETNEDAPLVRDAGSGVLGNDADPQQQVLTASLVSGPQHGTLSLAPDGSFTYVPNPDFHGTDGFSYVASNGQQTSNVAAVTIIVHPVNDAPLAQDDAYETLVDTQLSVAGPGVLNNDSDVDGDVLTVSLLSGTAHGNINLSSDGGFLYSPNAGFVGLDSFTYTVSDGSLTATAMVVITVNTPPSAEGDLFDVDEDETLTIAAPGVLANDTDVDGQQLTAVDFTQPAHGSVEFGDDGSFTYTPSANFFGTDSFTYRAHDGLSASTPATVTITVHPVNDAPDAADDTYVALLDEALVVPAPGVLANDSDVDGDTLTVSLVSAPANGILELSPDGSFTYTPAAGFLGSVSFTYAASDGVLSGTATVVITVNIPPTAAGDTFQTDEDVPLVVAAPGVLENDSDEQGDELAAVDFSQPAHGSLAGGSDGSFTYTPSANFHGVDSFTYRASDGLSTSGPATVTITVHPVNDEPVAEHDAFALFEGATLAIDEFGVLQNDLDVDGDELTAILVDDVQHGTLTFSSGGQFTYVPAAEFHGTDSFTYVASDGQSSSALATVTLTVLPVNDPPQAAGDAYETDEDVPLAVAAPGVLENDSDVDGDPLTAVLVSQPEFGHVVLAASGAFTYTPDEHFHGSDSFTYRASDGGSSSGLATVTITVHSINDEPLVNHDEFELLEDSSLAIDDLGVLANDFDADGDTLTAILVDDVAHGALTFSADGLFTYVPAADFFGIDSFTYRATDGTVTSGLATVTLTVMNVNDPPQAEHDEYETDEDVPLTVAAPGVLANDTDVDFDQLFAELVWPPDFGVLELAADGSFTYTPGENFHGVDSFTYRANDGAAISNLATVTITVAPVNDAPQAHDDHFTTPVNQQLVLVAPGMLANDTDVDGDPLTASLVLGPAHGTLVMGTDGSFLYQPAAGFHGADSFAYRASDGSLHSTAVVTIAVNSPPAAEGDAFSATEDTPLVVAAPGVLANDTDLDGDSLAADLISPPLAGSLVLNADGSFTYAPFSDFNGLDSFTYRANDGLGASNVATVTIDVQPLNDAPVAQHDEFATDEDEPLSVPDEEGVLANDFDADGDTLFVLLQSGPQHGQLDLGPQGGFTYFPSANFHGLDSFTYKATDLSEQSDVATVTLVVLPVNDDPQAAGDDYTTTESTPLTVAVPGVLGNDSDIDGDTLQAVLVDPPASGSLALAADGSFTYTPDGGFTGTDSFTYVASDGESTSNPAVVTITVAPVNLAPVAGDDEYFAEVDTPLVVDAPGVLDNDSDPNEGQSLTAVLVGLPKHGSVSLGADGSFTYTPDPGYEGPDSFTYAASDGELSDVATVIITVQNLGGGEALSSSWDAALLALLMGGESDDPQAYAWLAALLGDWESATDQILAESS